MTRPPVIIGAGLAGLATALRLAPEPCVVLCAGRLGSGAASGWAQGGIAAALGSGDSPELHALDTLGAGAGLCDPAVVRAVTGAAPEVVDWLSRLGARFDRAPDGGYDLGLEGAHGRHRIVHAGGDGSGAEVMRAVVAAVRRTPSITVLEHARARRLVLAGDGSVRGVEMRIGPDGERVLMESDRVVLATGGSGGLWAHTTNPRAATGSGLALAARAGAVLRDLEMVQFHPTALDVGRDPMPLVSEAVRGEGAVLLDADGRRLMGGPGSAAGTGVGTGAGTGDLAARDVVARAVAAQLRAGGHVGLDVREALGDRFAEHFPAIAQACREAGIDPGRTPLPVRPAAHYHCGGVLADLDGRTSVPGLWAVGEVASTGLHGANRLASNSLLEAAVCGARAAADLRAHARTRSGATDPDPVQLQTLPEEVGGRHTGRGWEATPGWVRELMDAHVGITRDGPGLAAAVRRLQQEAGPSVEDADDATLVALLVARSAQRRTESRGGHLRLDHPGLGPRAEHTLITLADVGATDATLRRSA